MKPRGSNNPKRRFAAPNRLNQAGRNDLAARVIYVGSPHHKKHPADYEFHPPVSPPPFKSVCDGKRVISKAEAAELLRQGVLNGMFQRFC